MEAIHQLILIVLAFGAVQHVESVCRPPPLWLFSLPEDIEPIFSGLTSPFILVDNGTVTTLISRPDPVVANLFFLNKDIFEFPVVFCISSEEFREATYSISLRSFDPSILVGSVTILSPGIVTSRPYRFRAIFSCIASSNNEPIIMEVSLNITRNDMEFCQTVFYVSKKCATPGTENAIPVGIADGYLNQNFSFKTPPTEAVIAVTKVVSPTTNIHLSITLPGVLVPLILITLIALLIAFIVWMIWYQKKRKEMAEFHPESVSMAYQELYSSWSNRQPHEKEFPRSKVHLIRELGEGAFGIVYHAEAEGIEDQTGTSTAIGTNVAVKQLREGSNEAKDFFREVDFMSKLEHPNVVRLLGVCSVQEPYSMIFEYMDLGDLCSFLRQAIGLGSDQDEAVAVGDEDETQEPLLTREELLIISAQIADGMVYISSLNLVHRDLATRNCLVATGMVVKIADFGMSRSVNSSDYYRVKGNALLPVRWMPPESILYGKFTMETDVWAFGILLWEIFTFGQQPYYGLQNDEVIKLIQKGGHPEPPDDCIVTQLMVQCWDKNPKKRPSFVTIASTITMLLEQEQ